MDVSLAQIQKILSDETLVNEVVAKVLEDPKVMDDLAENVADEIGDYLEDDPVFRKKILEAAAGSPDFRKRIIAELVNDLAD